MDTSVGQLGGGLCQKWKSRLPHPSGTWRVGMGAARRRASGRRSQFSLRIRWTVGLWGRETQTLPSPTAGPSLPECAGPPGLRNQKPLAAAQNRTGRPCGAWPHFHTPSPLLEGSHPQPPRTPAPGQCGYAAAPNTPRPAGASAPALATSPGGPNPFQVALALPRPLPSSRLSRDLAFGERDPSPCPAPPL